MAQDTDESRATVVVNEPVAAAAVAATFAATGVAVAAGRVVVIVQVVDIVVGVELLARGQSQGNKSHDLWLIFRLPPYCQLIHNHNNDHND